MKITEDAPIEVVVYRSPIDGALVVQIDTESETGDVRISLNDGPVWDGDPESTTGNYDLLKEIKAALQSTHRVRDGQTVAQKDAEFRAQVERILEGFKP